MNSSDARFRINALIQMARTTDNQEKREDYIAQAENELDEMYQSPFHDNSIEQFFEEKCKVGNEFRTERRDIYNKYLIFCEECSFSKNSKNALYRYLREKKVREVKSTGFHSFGLIILE